MFPLSLLPDGVQSLVTALPFAYETYYPSLILLQRVDASEAMRVVGMQLLWVVTLFAAVRVAWSRGLRRYAAYGG
jgi:ABC-2 type transport system permease protein